MKEKDKIPYAGAPAPQKRARKEIDIKVPLRGAPETTISPLEIMLMSELATVLRALYRLENQRRVLIRQLAEIRKDD